MASAKAIVSIGPLAFPVRLHVVAREGKTRFNEVHAACKHRLKRVRYCPACKIPTTITEDALRDGGVPYSEVAKGVEVKEDTFVTFTKEELEPPEEGDGIVSIDGFTPSAGMNPLLREKAYYVSPDKGGARSYALLHRALRTTGCVAIGKRRARANEHLVTLEAGPKGLLILWQLWYAAEVTPPDNLPGTIPAEDTPLPDKEVALAESLVTTLTLDTPVTEYVDERDQIVRSLVEAKQAGVPILSPKPAAQATDMVVALQAALLAAKSRGKAA